MTGPLTAAKPLSSGLDEIILFLHQIAGVVLLVFAVSHFADLVVPRLEHTLNNLVFPFLTNRPVFFAAALLALTAGILSLKFAGRDIINIVILAFVGLIVSYRWAFYSLGGTKCGCTGILGLLLQMTPAQQRIAPLFALGVLTATTAPWLVRITSAILRRTFARVPILLLVTALTARAEQTIEVAGIVDGKNQNPRTGRLYSNMLTRVTFSVLRSGERWKISATNRDDQTWWTEVAFDGTNTYKFSPLGGDFYFQKAPESSTNYGLIWPSAFFSPGGADILEISTIWLAYCLSPEMLKTNRNGIIDLPLPWQKPRRSPLAYGFKWLPTPSDDRMFLANCEIVRDRSLDLNDEAEFLRPELDYPENVDTLNSYRFALRVRKSMRTGFVESKFRSTDWARTNGFSIPMAAEFMRYMKDSTNFPVHEAKLKVTRIALHNGLPAVQPALSLPTQIADYRYKRRTDDRIFSSAKYVLAPGDPWKSESDASLLEEVQKYLTNGPKFREYRVSAKTILMWSVLAAVALTPALAALWQVQQKKQNKIRKGVNT